MAASALITPVASSGSFLISPNVGLMIWTLLLFGLSMLILWIPVLLGGRYPVWGYALVGGTLQTGRVLKIASLLSLVVDAQKLIERLQRVQ